MNFFAYGFSDAMILRMYNAREVDAQSAPRFHRLVEELATRANLPMPHAYLIDDAQPNAFATGRNPEQASFDRGARRTASRDRVAHRRSA